MDRQPLDDKKIEGWWDVARVGCWRGSQGGAPAEVELTASELEQIAADYDPSLQEAPVTVEHMRSGPAHGWVDRLRVAGDRLQARFRDISAQLRQWLASGAYRSRSIELYKPFASTGRPYLGAVTFLGAAAPAVKGLSPEPSVLAEKGAEEQSVSCIECMEMGLEETPEPVQPDVPSGADSRIALLEAETVSLRTALEEERAARLRAESGLGDLTTRMEEITRRSELEGFERALNEAVELGCLTPAERKTYSSLAERLDEPGRAALLESVSQRGKLALFSELSAFGPADPARDEELRRSRASFEGFPEDPEHDAALELMAHEQHLSFTQALARVRSENPSA
jgi:hypothetical protein